MGRSASTEPHPGHLWKTPGAPEAGCLSMALLLCVAPLHCLCNGYGYGDLGCRMMSVEHLSLCFPHVFSYLLFSVNTFTFKLLNCALLLGAGSVVVYRGNLSQLNTERKICIQGVIGTVQLIISSLPASILQWKHDTYFPSQIEA